MRLHVGFVSYHASTTMRVPEMRNDVRTLGHYAVSLQQHGCQVQWLTSTSTTTVLAEDMPLVPTNQEDLPQTCRYVVPCQPYRLAGVQLLGVEPIVWERSDLHTRLYTLLCLLHRQQPYDVLHAWGETSAAYLCVYTACFLGIPSVVSYSARDVTDSAFGDFRWQWVAQHVSMALVEHQAGRDHLHASSALFGERIHVISTASPTIAPTVMALYRRLPAG
jgi:hypothetical protein